MALKSFQFVDSRCAAACSLLALGLFALSSGSAQAKATYITFDDGVVARMNSTNTVTGWRSDGSSFVRTADGTVTVFNVPGATQTEAASINDAGEVAGFYRDGSGKGHGFVRAPDGTVMTFDVPKASGTGASDVNSKGEIAGFYNDDTGSHGFLRAAGGRISPFDVPGAIFTSPTCINDKGVITGSYIDADHQNHGFMRDRDGIITTIDVPGAVGTFGGCINVKGVMTGQYWDSDGTHGFVRASDGTVTTFSGGDCDVSTAGINRKAVIAASCQAHANPKHFFGFVLHPDGRIKNFHVPGHGPHTMPVDINDSGVIAGNYNYGGFLRFP